MSSKEMFLLAATGAILFTILVMAIFGQKGMADLSGLKKELAAIVKENERIAHENRLFLHEIDRLKNDLQYIESVARKDLGFVSKEEVIFQTRPTP